MSIQKPKNYEDASSKVKDYVNEMGIKCYSRVFLEKLTSEFSASSIVGRGGYGVVYKGKLRNGEQVAIKNLGTNDIVEETFMAEVSTMSNTNHKNLIKLKGYCFEPNMKALVYEYMEKGSLDNILYKPDTSIKWETLYRIATEIAEGLNYFHFGSTDQIIHYDIKAGNVLLDNNLSPKITDFGLAKLIKRDVSEVSLSRIRGTQGYSAPELHSHGYGSIVTNKCDVYSFGMLLFEILGKRNISREEGEYFPRQVWNRFNHGELECLFDHIGITKENRKNAEILTVIALLCIQEHPNDRPTMKDVWLMLGKIIPVPCRPSLPSLLWRSSTSSMTSENNYLISEDDFDGSYESRTIEAHAASFSSSLTPLSELTLEDSWRRTSRKTCYYEGTHKNNNVGEGQVGSYVWANGDEYNGEWKNGARERRGKFSHGNGNFYKGTLRNSKKDGRGRSVWVNGENDVRGHKFFSQKWRFLQRYI